MKTNRFSFIASFLLALAAILTFSCTTTESDGDGNNNGGNTQGGDNTPSGGAGTIKEITIKNNTGYIINNGALIKPSTSTDWGSNILYSGIPDGQSLALTLSQALSANNAYDIKLGSPSGNTFTKYKVTMSNAMTLTFTNNDAYDESNFPNITIQNRTGVNFDAIYIRPSSVPETSSDWGKNYGGLSNNSDESISIPIPLSSYTAFDIQMRSSNPTNTYTKKNVTISDGMIVTYTGVDSDNPLTGSPVIVIQNNTGYIINNGAWIKPSTSTDWGSSILNYGVPDGQSQTFTLSQSLSTNNVYDFQLKASSGGNTFTKYNVTVSEGMIVTFNVGDLEVDIAP
jgi:hypothetical protein